MESHTIFRFGIELLHINPTERKNIKMKSSDFFVTEFICFCPLLQTPQSSKRGKINDTYWKQWINWSCVSFAIILCIRMTKFVAFSIIDRFSNYEKCRNKAWKSEVALPINDFQIKIPKRENQVSIKTSIGAGWNFVWVVFEVNHFLISFFFNIFFVYSQSEECTIMISVLTLLLSPLRNIITIFTKLCWWQREKDGNFGWERRISFTRKTENDSRLVRLAQNQLDKWKVSQVM